MSAIPIEERTQWVGASESAVLLGLSPFGTPYEIWHQKRGTLPAAVLDGIERIEAGWRFEPVIAAWADDNWDDWSLVKVEGYLQHPTESRMGASLDYRTSTTHLPVEIKNVDGFQFRTAWAGENEDGSAKVVVPMHYQIQLQHQIACSAAGTPGGWIVACVGGNHIDRFYFERNDELIAQIEVSITEFWESIDAREEPSPDFEQDSDAIAKLYSKAGTSTADLTGDNHIPVLCEAYVNGMAKEKAGKAEKKAAKAEILTIIGENAKALVRGFSVSAGMVAEAEVKAYTRKGYRNFRVNKKKGI
jgi:putative phage-type endonuclease